MLVQDPLLGGLLDGRQFNPIWALMARRTCSIDGCDRDATTRGWCPTHYSRWRVHGSPHANLAPKRPRGLTKAEVADYEMARATPDNGCLLAATHIASGGYGRVRFEGTLVYLHRLVLEAELGRELLDEEYALHRCHRPACINPKHLYAGTHQQNMEDKAISGRASRPRGEAAGTAKLTDPKVLEIRRRYKGGWFTQRRLAEEFGVAQSTIGAVLRGKTWRNLSLN